MLIWVTNKIKKYLFCRQILLQYLLGGRSPSQNPFTDSISAFKEKHKEFVPENQMGLHVCNNLRLVTWMLWFENGGRQCLFWWNTGLEFYVLPDKQISWCSRPLLISFKSSTTPFFFSILFFFFFFLFLPNHWIWKFFILEASIYPFWRFIWLK